MKYILYLFIATFFWGSTFSFTKYLLAYLNPLYILFLRFFISAIIIYIFSYKEINKNIINMFTDKLFIIFGICNFLAYFLQTQGLEYTSASNTAFITASACLMVPFVKKIHKIESNISYIHYVSIFISLLGIYIMSFGFLYPKVFNIGDILIFISAILYSYFIIYLELLTKKYKIKVIVFFTFISIALPSLSSFCFNNTVKFILDFKVVLSLFVLVLVGTLLTNILVVLGQSKVSSEKASLIYTLEPIFAVFFAFFFLNEVLSLNLIIGSSLVLIAIFYSLFFDIKKN